TPREVAAFGHALEPGSAPAAASFLVGRLAALAGASTLSELGVDEDQLPELATLAQARAELANTPGPPGVDELRALLLEALQRSAPMRLLILGGTQFLGRHVAAEALRHGHELTLFNRGRTDPDAFPEAERITGDRDGGLDGLAGRDFDAVIDTSGYLPRVVRA